ncbi:hypothetical protein E6O75_ATG05299 [Venturia nashicola]|uniref:Cep57 centrosome microtubule-binding domain-containing protein n=1 Tax=Venturia nashicola TaxID=86259 RepID=A0A4Z1NZ08_9PEZI|nr:hypothetical protein E6O75_ATG05299 [Venturia nashicola]
MSDTERSPSASASAIRELSSDRPRRSPAPPTAHSSEGTSTTFNSDKFENDALASTRNIDLDDDSSHYLPKFEQKIRATAQKMGQWSPPQPAQHVPTSVVNRNFQDFDENNTFLNNNFDQTEESIEIGRGLGHTPSRANRSSARLHSDIMFDDASFIAGTPPPRSRPTPKSSLRREAVRNASGNASKMAEVYKKNKNSPRQRPEETTRGVRGSRFGRNVSGSDTEGWTHKAVGTPRTVANGTAQSFMLPDLPNLTELVSGNFKDGTPIFSRSGRNNTRFSSVPSAPFSKPNFVPLSGMAVPEDEKAILAALQLMKDKFEQLTVEKEEADRKIEEYEDEAVKLRAQLVARQNFRRSDSALGSTDGEDGSAQTKWQIEKTQLETSIQSLQSRLERADRKTTFADIATKRITQERDSLVTQLGVAFYNAEEVRVENETLRNENRLLQDQVSDLQAEKEELVAENEALRDHLDASHDRHEGETEKWTKREAALNRKAATTDRLIYQENQTLREELAQARKQQEDAARKIARAEDKARREAEKKARVEHAKLEQENEILKQELEQAQAVREAEIKRWASKQADMKSRMEQREETIHQLQSIVPQSEVNDQLRQQNDDLRAQLARLNAESQGTPKAELRQRLAEVTEQREDATQRWAKKESRLREQLGMAREAVTINRQLGELRNNAQPAKLPSKGKRRSAGQTGANVDDSILEQAESEVRKAKSSRAPNQPRSRSKSQSRHLSRPEASQNLRQSSAPAAPPQPAVEDESDASTTDLSFDPAVIAGVSRTIPLKSRRSAPAVPQHTGDTTFLSFIDGDEIAKLRKKLEEEYVANRNRRNATASGAIQPDDLTSRSRGTRNLTRKTSQKDLTGRSRASSRARSHSRARNLIDDLLDSNSDQSLSDDDLADCRQDTVHSNMSRASHTSGRRRSTGFTEMTSAFILPDITMKEPAANARVDSVLDEVPAHDSKRCSVCKRIVNSNSLDIDSIQAPIPIPVSTRTAADADATMRPTQGPVHALALILKQLNDEVVHLKLNLHVVEEELRTHDPSLGKSARKLLHERVDVLNRSINAKSDQIYMLYDVVEAHKVDIEKLRAEEALPEEVERTLEDIRAGREEETTKGRERKVYFGVNEDDLLDESEAPWAGVSDSEEY